MAQSRDFTLELIENKYTNSPFEFIIYKKKHTHDMIVEIPEKGRVSKLRETQLSDYIRLKEITTDWERDIFGNYFKYDKSNLSYIFPLTTDIRNFYIKIRNPFFERFRETIEEVENDFFKLVNNITIQLNLPFYPIWVRCEKKQSQNYIIKKLLMNYDETNIIFPYGNTYANNNLCLGTTQRNQKTTEGLLLSFLESNFNTGLNFQIKHASDLFRSIPEREIDRKPILDIYKIEEILDHSRDSSCLHLLDVLYYLSQISIEKFSQYPITKFFYHASHTLFEDKKRQ